MLGGYLKSLVTTLPESGRHKFLKSIRYQQDMSRYFGIFPISICKSLEKASCKTVKILVLISHHFLLKEIIRRSIERNRTEGSQIFNECIDIFEGNPGIRMIVNIWYRKSRLFGGRSKAFRDFAICISSDYIVTQTIIHSIVTELYPQIDVRT